VELSDLTESHVRVVWCQDHDSNDNVFADGTRLKLMGYDSRDGKGERSILPGLGNYNKPMITPRGTHVVFTDFIQKKAYIVDWDGSNLRQFADGQVLEAWLDADTGIEWIYVQSGPKRGKHFDGNPVYRHQTSSLSHRELVWDISPVSRDNFQLSADGKRAGGQFPWPQTGIADMLKHSWVRTGRGCWTSFAPDNSYLMWVFDGAHRFVTMLSADDSKRWKVRINTAPGINGAEVYHPRWSNRPRYFALTGPYTIRRGANSIRGGGPGVEVFVGRFNDALTEVARWVQITHNQRADFFPDVWFAGEGEQARRVAGQGREYEAAPAAMWPVKRDGLVFLWENRAAENEILKGARKTKVEPTKPQGLAKYGRSFDMALAGGHFATETANDHILRECGRSAQLSIEALITPRQVDQKGPASIISYASDASTGNFALGQKGNSLFVKLRTSRGQSDGTFSSVTLYTVDGPEPHHVIVTYKSGELRCYVAGKKVHVSRDISGDFTTWRPQHLVFGGERNGQQDWAGQLEGIAIYSRAMDEAEAAQSYSAFATRLRKRRPLDAVEVLLRLKEISETPSLEAIAPYRSCLVVYGYEVERIARGEIESQNVLVAHWAILNGRTIIDSATPGKSYSMLLEPFDDHPELEGERLIMNTEDIESPLYYDIGHGTHGDESRTSNIEHPTSNIEMGQAAMMTAACMGKR